MKNIKPYDKDALEFHNDVVKSKRNSSDDPTYKNRVLALLPEVKDQFDIFDNEFMLNKLEVLTNLRLSKQQKNDLIKLYSYKNKVLQKLKIKLTTDEQNRIVNTCQNCTIGEINSFDHFIPKDEFAEFSVNPKNLFPSCTKCNGLKSVAWRNGNKRIFLNLYLDNLPKEQYLFVDIKIVGSTIDLKYYLENKFGINADLYTLIENHYEKLNLFQRFKENSDLEISELENTIKTYLKHLDISIVKSVIIEKCEADKQVFGYNYWKAVLKEALVNNSDFINKFTSS